MTTKTVLNEKVLNQLYKYNLPYRHDNTDDKIIIDIPVKETINGDLFYTCPFCLDRRKKNGTPYKSSKALIHFHGDTLGIEEPHCNKESMAYWSLPPFKFNLVPYGTSPFVASKF